MQAQHLSTNGLLKEKSNGLPQYTSNETTSIYVDAEVFKNYLLLQRRALLQSVAADERLVGEVDTLLKHIENVLFPKVALAMADSNGFSKSTTVTVGGMTFDGNAILDILKKCIMMLKRNTEERRKAYLQIVRDTEKRYNLANQKKRGRFNRQGN